MIIILSYLLFVFQTQQLLLTVNPVFTGQLEVLLCYLRVLLHTLSTCPIDHSDMSQGFIKSAICCPLVPVKCLFQILFNSISVMVTSSNIVHSHWQIEISSFFKQFKSLIFILDDSLAHEICVTQVMNPSRVITHRCLLKV